MIGLPWCFLRIEQTSVYRPSVSSFIRLWFWQTPRAVQYRLPGAEHTNPIVPTRGDGGEIVDCHFFGKSRGGDLQHLTWPPSRYAQFGFTVNWLSRYAIFVGWSALLLALLGLF